MLGTAGPSRQPGEGDKQPSREPPAKRDPIIGHGQACTQCRSSKHRCDGLRAKCTPCQRSNRQCIYDTSEIGPKSGRPQPPAEQQIAAAQQRLNAMGASNAVLQASNEQLVTVLLALLPSATSEVQSDFLMQMLRRGYTFREILAAYSEMEESDVEEFLPDLTKFGQR